MYLRESKMNNSVFSNSEECTHKHTKDVGPTMTWNQTTWNTEVQRKKLGDVWQYGLRGPYAKSVNQRKDLMLNWSIKERTMIHGPLTQASIKVEFKELESEMVLANGWGPG